MNFFDKNELKILWPFYLEILISTIFFILPPFAIIYFQDIGLSLIKIGLLISSASIAALIFEVPVGAIADIWGRKTCVVFGYLCGGIALFSIAFTDNFIFILFLYFIWGLGGTLISGAYEAWIIDNLKFRNVEYLTKNFYSHRQIFLNLSLIFSGIIATLLVSSLGMSIIWFISGFSFLLSGAILFFIKENKLKYKREEKNIIGFFRQTLSSLKFSLKHKTIFLILIISIITSLAWSLKSDIIIFPLLKQQGMPIYLLGYLFSLSAIIGVFVPLISKIILKKNKKESVFLGYLLVFDAILALSVLLSKEWIFVGLIYLGMMAISDIRMPLFSNFFQELIPSKKRATLTSINSLFISVGTIISAPLAGFLGDNLSLSATLAISGIITLIGGLIFFKIK